MMICLFLSGVAGAQQAQCQSRRLTTMDADEEENMSECSSLNPKPSIPAQSLPCTLMCHLVPYPASLHPSHWTIPLTHTEEMSNGIILLSPGFKHGQNLSSASSVHSETLPYEHFGWQIYFIYWVLFYFYSIEKNIQLTF